MHTKVLFRRNLEEDGEFDICQQYFSTVEYRTSCYGDFVICRYSCLPYYKELVQDLLNNKCRLINSWYQHQWIANFKWYHLLKEYTPRTWFDSDFHLCKYDGPFVVKGRTNSRKFRWNTHMFAKTKRDAVFIGSELCNEEWIAQQGIVYRKYVPLKTFEIGLNGLPFTNEYRIFFLRNQRLACGYYWSIAENINHKLSAEGMDFACHIADLVSKHVNFFVLDIAEKEDGGWILIEINDGQMSGLSEVNAEELYENLWYHIPDLHISG